MLPQMMPLPWVCVFLMIFFCLFVFWSWASSFYSVKSLTLRKFLKSKFVSIPW